MREIARDAEAGTTPGVLIARIARALEREFAFPTAPTAGQVIGTILDEPPRRWWGRKALGPGP